MKEYDIIVIGAGAGTKLVTPPSLIGKKVAVFEKETPGGTCLNRGCIPSKMLIYPTEYLWASSEVEKFPIQVQNKPIPDFTKISERISSTVDADSASIPVAYHKNPNIDYYPHTAKFLNDKTIEANGEKFTAKHIFITVGSRPHIPNIEGLNETPYWTSREALRETKLPKSMIVIGAGFIGLEIGAAYQAYGCKVEGFTRTEILRGIDGEMREEFEAHTPFPIHSHFTITKVKFENEQFELTGIKSDGSPFNAKAEKLLVTTGIQPNTDDLGIEHTSILRNQMGFILVDEFLETNAKGVYAFGDVIGKYFFRHSANFEGEYLFETIFLNDKKTPIRYPSIPSAIFTHPQMASVGATEEELQSKGVEYYKGVNRYSSSAMGMARLSSVGFVKVLVDKKSETILGAHIIGDEASSLLQLLVLAIDQSITLDNLLRMVFIHPALPEVVRNALRKVKESKKLEKNN